MPFNLFSFSGRARRTEFCCALILLALTSAVAHLFGPLIWGPASLVLLVIFLALEVRRFHDLNMSGLWVLWNVFPPLALLLVITLALFEGTTGRNRFGRDPKHELGIRIG